MSGLRERVDYLDLLALLGLAMLAAGIALEFGPAWALMATGSALLAFVIAAAVRSSEAAGGDGSNE